MVTAACSADTSASGEPNASESDYKSDLTLVHQCMTSSSANKQGDFVPWASVAVWARKSRPETRLSASLQFTVTSEELAAMRAQDVYATAGVGWSTTAEASSIADQHYKGVDGTIELDMDLNQPHMLDHSVLSRGVGKAKIKVDFGTIAKVLPPRVRALGVQTYDFDLADCN